MCSMESAPQDARRTRSKRRSRRPKFLSLRLKLCPAENPPQDPEPQRQADLNLNLFPAPSDNPDAQDDSSVARFLNPEGGASHTLAGLLDDQQQHLVPSATTDPEDSPSPGYSRGWERDGGCEESLVRAAMRRRRNEAAGETERWVSCVDVFERKEEEVSSCSDGVRYHHRHQDPWEQSRCLSLKLDYEEIMTAWSDKGPLYVAGPESAAAAQTVPDINGDEFLGDGAGEVMDGWGCPGTGMAGNEGVCRVPVTDGTNGRSMTTTSNRMGDSEAAEEDCALMEMGEWKVGQRAASVLRYKEKRQNRLFSKRIRYEVRKLNAEKRPRLKGRFVKRS